MKKRLSILLAILMILSVMTGCNSDTGGSSAASEASASSATAVSSKPEESSKVEESSVASTEDSSATNEDYYDETVTLTVLIDQDWLASYEDALMALSDAALEKYNIQLELENRINGSDGDNLVKTRLAAGEMTDILIFNSGAQLMALNPEAYFMDLSDQDFINNVNDTFLDAVSSDGQIFGVPANSSSVGGIVYNTEVYDELGLEIPKTWDDFLANMKACKDAGYTAMLGTCGDSWSAQYVFLADHYNVLADYPNFAEDFETKTVTYAGTPIAARSWEKLSSVGEYYNDDYMAVTVMDGLEAMGEEGGAVHYAFSSQAFSYIESFTSKEVANKFSMYPIPSDDANVNGFTVWMPNGLYVNKDSENAEAALKFLEFYASQEGVDIFKQYAQADGPYLIDGVELPDDSYQGVLDLQTYFDEGKTNLALEFQTSLKGASCDQICVECVSGAMDAATAAAEYDADCEKMAIQLGLEGW